MNKIRLIIISIVFSLFSHSILYAEGLFLVRKHAKPEDVMLKLQSKLTEYGYKIAHIQKCDGGLEGMGYKTDYYKVVFFGKPKEVRKLSKKYPQLIPYLPLKIAIFSEKEDTLLTAVNPGALTMFFQDEEIKVQLLRWKNDIKAILAEVRHKNQS